MTLAEAIRETAEVFRRLNIALELYRSMAKPKRTQTRIAKQNGRTRKKQRLTRLQRRQKRQL